MNAISITKAHCQERRAQFASTSLIQRSDELLKQQKDSFRDATLKSGLNHQAIWHIWAGNRPKMKEGNLG